MRHRILLACCLLLVVTAVSAQPRKGADPITGTWAGEMWRDNSTERLNITIEMKLEGNVVSGTITGPPIPGTLKNGTFDAKTGALKFEVVLQDSSRPGAFFEGAVKDGSATGKVTINNLPGNFQIKKDAK